MSPSLAAQRCCRGVAAPRPSPTSGAAARVPAAAAPRAAVAQQLSGCSVHGGCGAGARPIVAIPAAALTLASGRAARLVRPSRGGVAVGASSAATPATASRQNEVMRDLPGGGSLKVTLNVDGSGKCNNETMMPFLDHMLDQLGTHGLFDVSVAVEGRGDATTDEDINAAAGSAVGEAYAAAGMRGALAEAVQFLSPLDESVTDVVVELSGNPKLEYGLVIPTQLVGKYETRLVEPFFAALVESAGLTLHLRSVDHPGKGNSHHVIEATFKAFARAMRRAIDAIDGRGAGDVVMPGIERVGGVKRATKETEIDLSVNINGEGACDSSSMIPFLDTMLGAIAQESGISMKVHAIGDVHIDDHHTNEDLAIVYGQSMKQALGDCKGINRMGSATATVDGATVQVTLDLSGRPHLGYDLEFADERIGAYDTQLVEHLYQSFANSSGTTLHVRQLTDGAKSEALAMAAATAFGRALFMACQYDERRMGAIASSKGVLEGFA